MSDTTPGGPGKDPQPATHEPSSPEIEATTDSTSGFVRSPAVGVRKGMFGAKDGGDTSGYGGLVAPIVYPGQAERPYGGWHDIVADSLEGLVESVVIHRGEITFHIARGNLQKAMRTLRDEQRFEFCAGVNGVHYPDDAGRELHAVYSLLSMTHNRRIRVETTTPDSDRHLPSCVAIYPTLDWHEREAWDFFGMVFDGHPALTRIQMPDDWPGHPQRKDYPLGGIPVEYKGGTVPPPDQRRSYS
ncbi:NADH-quinone oxidoreductase subunit C [Nocardioides sp.]|uniref:NADH-quinone oxidoreductase subunit C n=1 Tax=Nocardioides sp. TaxID=35761 RepID=UPI0039C91DFC